MTTPTPKTVRITDLADPQYTDAELAALAAAEARPIELTVDAVLAAAEAAVGLDDFGPEDFRERLNVMLSEVDRHPFNTAWGRLDFFESMVRMASNRLRIRHLLTLHPEIAEIEIKRPIFIVGMPRTGTTDLLNTMAADSRFRTMTRWESQQPVPDDPEQLQGAVGDEDPRLQRARREYEERRGILPYRDLMHPTNPEFIEEEYELEVLDFFVRRTPLAFRREMLSWREDLVKWRSFQHQMPHYTWIKIGLQILHWYRPAERFLGKAILHMENLGPLLRHFPDATIVFTHRDPVAVVQSAATMMCYQARMSYTRIDPAWYLDFYKGFVHRCLQAYLRDRSMVPKERTMDVFFDELRVNQMGIIERIYELAGFPLTQRARAEIDRDRDRRARGFVPVERGKVVYDLRADYGVDPEDIRQEFDYYLKALPVAPEVM
jgi:hypothetical protein